MVLFQKINMQTKILTSFSPKRVITFEFNWIKFSSVWMLIVFGFYGWGTLSSSESTSIPSLLMSIALVSVFSTYYFFGDSYASKLMETVTIQIRQIYAVFGIFLLLCIINVSWIFRSLTGDEIAYALQSQGQSYVILKKVLPIFPQFGDFQFRVLLQLCSVFILVIFFLVLKMVSRIKSVKHFILMCFLGTLLLRIGVISQGGSNGPNPPGASFLYLVGTSILSPSNFSYRILSLLFASIFLIIIHALLKQIPNLSMSLRFLILFFVLSIPLFRHMGLVMEISIWYFYFATIALLLILRSKGVIGYQLIFIGALATSLRFPIIALLIPLYAIEYFDLNRGRIKFRLPPSYVKSTLGLLPCIPGFIWIATTRFIDKYTGEQLTNGTFRGQASEIGRSAREVFSTLSVTTDRIFWIICMVGVFIFIRKSLFNIVLMILFGLFEFLFFFVLNSGDMAYASKYILEWYVPFVVFGLVSIVSRFEISKSVKYAVALCLIALISINAADYNRIPEKFVITSIAKGSGDLVFSNANRVVVSIPFPYNETFNKIKGRQELAGCLNVGIVYGVYPQILEGYSVSNVLSSLSIDHNFLLAQDSIGENWMTASATSIEKSGTHCVIVGFVDGQEKTIKDLLEKKWQIRDRFFDENYHTKVFILTR